MGYLPFSHRRLPIPASGSSELIMATPRRVSRGGDGHFSAARIVATSNGTTTTIVVDPTTGLSWSEFETDFLTIATRCEGLQMAIGGRLVTITDHTYGAPDATLTFTPALPAATATGDVAFLGPDIPPYVAKLLLKTAGANVQFNTRAAGQIANNIYETLINGEGTIIIDTETGAAGRPVYIRAAAAATTVLEVEIYVP